MKDLQLTDETYTQLLFLYNITVDINLPQAKYSISVGYLHVSFLKSLQETTPSLKLATYSQVTLIQFFPKWGSYNRRGEPGEARPGSAPLAKHEHVCDRTPR